MKKRVLVAMLAMLIATTAYAAEPVRLDASSDAAAEASWKRMVASSNASKKQKLLEAMLKINLAGVKTASDVVHHPEMHSLGIARIKERVAGMTADEIIEYGERVGTVQIEKTEVVPVLPTPAELQ